MIAPFSKFKEDLKESGLSIYSYSNGAREDFINSLEVWSSYSDLKIDSHRWWEVFHWEPPHEDDDGFNYNISPKMSHLTVTELLVDREYISTEDIPMINQCSSKIAREAHKQRGVTYARGSVALLLRGIDAAYEIQTTIGDSSLHDILDI